MAQAGLLGKHKYLPYRRWFRQELSPILLDGMARAREAQLPWVNERFLRSMQQEHATGHANHLYTIDKVLTLESVHRQFLQGEAFKKIEQLHRRANARSAANTAVPPGTSDPCSNRVLQTSAGLSSE